MMTSQLCVLITKRSKEKARFIFFHCRNKSPTANSCFSRQRIQKDKCRRAWRSSISSKISTLKYPASAWIHPIFIVQPLAIKRYIYKAVSSRKWMSEWIRAQSFLSPFKPIRLFILCTQPSTLTKLHWWSTVIGRSINRFVGASSRASGLWVLDRA